MTYEALLNIQSLLNKSPKYYTNVNYPQANHLPVTQTLIYHTGELMFDVH